MAGLHSAKIHLNAAGTSGSQTNMSTSNLKYLVPSPIRQVFRRVLDLCAEGVDYLPRRRSELLPPARLNRSGAGDFKAVGGEFLRHFKVLGGLTPDKTVLDVGCGIGRMAVSLTRFLNNGSKYEGFDIMAAQVRWCRRRISARHPNFSFRVADVYNHSYNPSGRCTASEYTFVFGDRTFDFVFATSLFTHLLPAEMERYISEIGRVMKPGARCLITFFLLTPESLGLIAAKRSTLDFAYQSQGYLTIDKEAPERAVAYDEEHVRTVFEKCGLTIIDPVNYGSWCGRTEFLSYQDVVVAHKAS
jgi:SAM-dependent methyltransferase